MGHLLFTYIVGTAHLYKAFSDIFKKAGSYSSDMYWKKTKRQGSGNGYGQTGHSTLTAISVVCVALFFRCKISNADKLFLYMEIWLAETQETAV